MAAFNSCYLVSGQDETKIDSWRMRLRRRAEEEAGPGALEAFDARQAHPSEVAIALSTLTLTDTNRYVLADGVERWKEADLGPLKSAISNLADQTICVLIARGRQPSGLAEAVRSCGGEVYNYQAPKPYEMAGWLRTRAKQEGLELDQSAAQELISLVGTGQMRLAREVEKLATMVYPATDLGAGQVAQLATGELEPRGYELADALIRGDESTAIDLASRMCAGQDRPSRHLFAVVRRVRDAYRARRLLDSGMTEQQTARTLDMPAWAAKKTTAQVKTIDPKALQNTLCVLADLEVGLRRGEEDEQTIFIRAVQAACA
jgi:DNA polymerase III subunit delta